MHLYTCTYKAGHVGTCPPSQCCYGEMGGGGWGAWRPEGHVTTRASQWKGRADTQSARVPTHLNVNVCMIVCARAHTHKQEDLKRKGKKKELNCL